MLLQATTKMSEFMTIHPSHFGCIKSAVLKGLEQVYIDGFCPGLGIGIKVSDVSEGSPVIDPNEGCCITRCTFLLTFHVFSFDDTEEKVAVKFEGESGQDASTLCKYLDPENELPTESSIRLLCVAHLV